MKRTLLIAFFGIGLIVIILTGLVVIPYFSNTIMPWNRTNAIETTLTWGGLADIPENAHDISVDTEGSMFTREFTVEFNIGVEEINEWIKVSKRLKDAAYINEGNGIIRYEIYPGEEGAQGGTVRIDKHKQRVIINMSWS